MTTDVAGAERLTAAAEPVETELDASPIADVLREITRGGLAGLIVGVLLAGVGGRLLMRLAAILVPGSVGSVTENGNLIGRVTLDGTLGLIAFVGLFFGAVAGSLWVVIRPWLPERASVRAVMAVPIAIGLGTLGLVDHRNPDFAVLERDPVVVASLVILVALFGPALVLVEQALDARLPRPHRGDQGVIAWFAAVAVLGSLLTISLVMPLFLGSQLVVSGLALVVVGLATLASWRRRILRRARSQAVAITGRAGLAIATVAGLLVATREVVGALGLD